MTTPKESNPLRMLFILYFAPCDLMHQHHRRLKAQFFAGEYQRDQIGSEFITFTLYWFASLFVVVEGWKKLNIKEPKIDKMIDEHWDSLRIFRNAVFHFQPEDRKHKQFFDVAKFNWAEELHAALQKFFESEESKLR